MKIFDALIFNDESMLLEVRLHELADVVDYHVVVEADTTFSGKPKPLHFEAEWDRWIRDSEFAEKIIHIVVRDMPSGPDPWVREHWQRNAIIRGLDHAGAYDPILISDGDEVPRASSITFLRDNEFWRTTVSGVFEQRGHYYWLNMLGCPPNDCWYGTRFTRRGALNDAVFHNDAVFPQQLRTRSYDGVAVIPNGGWHWSYLGGPDRIRSKVASYSHHDLATPQNMSDDNLRKCLATGDDLFGRDYIRFKKVPFDESYPKYLRENAERFKEWILP